MAGTPFNISVGFGTSIGPTYSGQIIVSSPNTGDNPVLIDQVVGPNVTNQVIYSPGVKNTNLLGFGFLAKLVTNGSGAQSANVSFVGTNISYLLTPANPVIAVAGNASMNTNET